MMTKTYEIREKIWLYPGKAGWYFVTLPVEVARDIDYYFALDKRGWGSLPVQVILGSTTWETSIFPDKKSSSYVLPVKAQVRKNERVVQDQEVSIALEIVA